MTPTLLVPPSKSHAIRAIVLAALSQGMTELDFSGTDLGVLPPDATMDGWDGAVEEFAFRSAGHLPDGPEDGPAAIVLPDDIQAAIQVANALGCRCVWSSGKLLVHPAAKSSSSSISEADAPEQGELSADCGESALLFRTMLCLAGTGRIPRTLVRRGTLAMRPAEPLFSELRRLGMDFSTTPDGAAVRVTGFLSAGDVAIDGSMTSQLATGLLFALARTGVESTLTIANATSIPYLSMTRETMARFGVHVHETTSPSDFPAASSDASSRRPSSVSLRFQIPGGQTFQGCRMRVEGDWSAAAFLLVAQSILALSGHPVPVRLYGCDPSSIQGDREILRFLRMTGLSVVFGPRSDGLQSSIPPRGGPSSPLPFITVRRAEGQRALRPIEADLTHWPDLLPPLATLALFCDGTSTFTGIGRTSLKESDRPKALAQAFSAMGAEVTFEGGDKMSIRGGRRLHLAAVDVRGDHRIAMAAAVAAWGAGHPLAATDAARNAVAKSFPGFFQMIGRLPVPRFSGFHV